MSGPVPYWSDGQVSLHLGDCLDVLAAMDAASVDAVVTDPPYGLEFMGKEWDSFRTGDGFRRSRNPADAGRDNVFGRQSARGPEYGTGKPSQARIRTRVDGRTNPSEGKSVTVTPESYTAGQPFQFWCQRWAAECLRVLKPGGFMLAFGGPRTWHRLACAIEDAGFEIRDSVADLTGYDAAGLMWVYGCLSADAEILTERGWKPGIEVKVGERVAQWDSQAGRVSLAAVQEKFRAPWDSPMRVLRNADTDQLLTPNHRVWHRPRKRQMSAGTRRVWFDPEWEVAAAGTLSTWNTIKLPIAGEHDGSGIGGEDFAALLGWVWTEGGFDLSGTGVRIYQSSVNADKVAEIAALMDRLGPHKRYDQPRTYMRRNGEAHSYTAVTWYFSGAMAERVRAELPGKRPTYGLLWRMTASEKRALLRAAMLGDGSGLGTQCEQFYQQHEDDLIWFQTLLALIGRAGKVTMRGNRPGGSVTLRQRGTTELQARHLRDSAEHYTGEVWCVRVPTGAFIARRNGKVFITGNSGFPKSLDVSKAIDKAAGAEREVTGKSARHIAKGEAVTSNLYAQDAWTQANGRMGEFVTAPATDDAAQWEGWGTALKPAWEPVIVARKPLAGTAVNVVEMVESGLRERGITGAIAWTISEPAKSAVRPRRRASSSRTRQPPAGETSAGPADESGRQATASVTEKLTGNGVGNGDLSTPDGQLSIDASLPINSGPRSSSHTGIPVPAAESLSKSSSSLTTSKVEAQPTGKPSTARSTSNCDAKDSHPDTESFAGIATGLTGSRATVHISRLPDGTFVWPDGLPRSVPGGSLTVAQNVLEHGTGALNVDGCRVPTSPEDAAAMERANTPGSGRMKSGGSPIGTFARSSATGAMDTSAGRWPPNVLLGAEAAAELDAQSGALTSGANPARRGSDKFRDAYGEFAGQRECTVHRGADSGGASRFFPVFRYQAKAGSAERPRILRKAMRLRADLTEQERAYVLAELTKAGVDVS